MSAKPWYPRYPRDFRAKTIHLNLTERGAYDALLDHYYELQSPLPVDHDALYRIAGAFSEQDRAAVDRVAKEFFENGDGTLTNERCEEELAKMRARSEQQSELANRRWHSGGNAKAHAKAMPARGEKLGNASHSQKSQSEVKVRKPLPAKPSGAETWQAYATAYRQRYGVDPVRNAKVNGMIARLIASIGQADAPPVAAFYVSLNSSWYVAKGHAIQFLLADAEKIRTEWATGRQITTTEAQQADKRQSNKGVFQKLIQELTDEKTKN